MGNIINLSAYVESKRNKLLSNKKTETSSAMYPRLDKTEKNSFEKACKLAGNNPVARSILMTILDYTSPMQDATMEFINDVGVYDERIPLLFWACDCNPYNFEQAVRCFFRFKVDVDKIMQIKTKHEFTELVEKYKVQELDYQYEYYDDGD